MTATLLLIFVCVFVGTFPLFSVVMAARQSRQIRKRVQRLGESSENEINAAQYVLLRDMTRSEQVIARVPVARDVKKQLELSGMNISALNFILFTAVVAAGSFIAMFIWKESLPAALLAALGLGVLPLGYVINAKHKRNELFAEQLPTALTMVARSLRAGHSLPAAVELIGQELPEPAGGMFRLAYEQQKLGVRMVDCLVSLRSRIESPDFSFFTTIIRINSESGGNLSEILDKLAETLRSRLQIRRQVGVLTAEGRISGHILVALPVVMFVVFYLLRPGYLDVFFTERVCQLFLGAAVVGQVIGYVIIRRIVNISI